MSLMKAKTAFKDNLRKHLGENEVVDHNVNNGLLNLVAGLEQEFATLNGEIARLSEQIAALKK